MQSGGAGNLGEALRTQTRQLHGQVERSGIMQDLLRGRIDRSGYCALLRNLHAIYVALEDALERHAGHPHVSAIALAGLARRDALADDLESLGSGHWTSLPLMPATTRYVRRLGELDASNPGLLVAHAYVRYLGDLSGGQMLRRVIARTFGLCDSTGTRFYVFGEPDDAAALAVRFRAGLDAIALQAEGIATLVAEAQWGFTRHAELFDELRENRH